MSTGNADYEEFIRRSREAIAAAFTTLKAQNPGADPIEQESGVKASSRSSVARVLSRKRTQCCPSSDESTSSADSSADAVSSKGIFDESLPRTIETVVSRKRSRPSLTRPIPHNISVQETQRVEVKHANETGAPETSNALHIKEWQTKMQLSVQGELPCVEVAQTNETGFVPKTANQIRIKEWQTKMRQIGMSSMPLQFSETPDNEEASVDDVESDVDDGDIAEDESATESSDTEADDTMHGSKIPLHASSRIEGLSSVSRDSGDERETTKVTPSTIDTGQTRQSGVVSGKTAGLTREQMDQPSMVLKSPACQLSEVKCYKCRLNWHLLDSRLVATPHTQLANAVGGQQPGCSEMTPLPPKRARAVEAREDQFNKPETNPILVTATKLCRPATARTVDVVPQTDKNKKNETNDGDPHLTPRPRIDTGMRISDARMRPLGPDFVEPGEFDVICDRGNLALKHPGNLRLKSTIESKLAEYAKATSKTQKTFIVTSIVDSVRDANGGFVKCKNGEWFEVGDFLAREKIGQWYVLDCALLYLVDENVELGPLTETCRSLRDTLHMMYKSSTKAKRARMAAHKKVKPLFAVPQIVLMPKHEDGTYLYFDTEYPNGIAEAAKTTGDMLSFTPTLPGPSEIARFAASLRSAECDVDYPTMHYVPGPYGPFR
jgi:hypothetical protein